MPAFVVFLSVYQLLRCGSVQRMLKTRLSDWFYWKTLCGLLCGQMRLQRQYKYIYSNFCAKRVLQCSGYIACLV